MLLARGDSTDGSGRMTGLAARNSGKVADLVVAAELLEQAVARYPFSPAAW